MKIAVSSLGNSLDSAIDPRFGRCVYFLIVDPADMDYAVYDNQSAAQGSGAGIQAAQFLAGKNVAAVMTGHIGPNAAQILTAAGIDIFAEQHGTIREVVARYKSGGLKSTEQSTVGSHFGMRRGAGLGGRSGQGLASAGSRRKQQGAARGRDQRASRGLGRSGSRQRDR